VSANFKVVPRPRQTRTFLCEFASSEEALRFRDRVLASPLTPMCVEIISPHAQDYLRPAPEPRGPDFMQPIAMTAAQPAWRILLRAAGREACWRVTHASWAAPSPERYRLKLKHRRGGTSP